MKKCLLIDMNNIISRIYFSLNYKKETLSKNDINNTAKAIFQNINNLTSFHNLKNEDVYCIFDTKEDSWRSLMIDDYKDGRESNKYLGILIEYFVEHSEKTFGFKSLQIPKIEADDIIAYISIYDKSKDIIIVSNDKDMEQLLLEYNVKIIDTKENGGFKKINPVESLVEKIIFGDKSDTIKGILKGIEPTIQYGDKKLKALFEEKFNIGETVSSMCAFVIDDILSRYEKKVDKDKLNEINTQLINNIEKNENLISFYRIPNEILKTISTTYNEIEFKSLSEHILNDNVYTKTREV